MMTDLDKRLKKGIWSLKVSTSSLGVNYSFFIFFFGEERKRIAHGTFNKNLNQTIFLILTKKQNK